MNGDYNETQNFLNRLNRTYDGSDNNDLILPRNVFDLLTNKDDSAVDLDGSNFRNDRGDVRGTFRPDWMKLPPPSYRGRGFVHGAPASRGRGYYRGGRGQRFGFDRQNNWVPAAPMNAPAYVPPPNFACPPPNIVAQPSFANQNAVPSNPSQPDLWVEATTPAGRPYYYHSRTRETTWNRPFESPACRVVTHEEMEVMASNGEIPEVVAAQSTQGTVGVPSVPVKTVLVPQPPVNFSQPPPPFTQPPPWDGPAELQDIQAEDASSEIFVDPLSFSQPPPMWMDGYGGVNREPWWPQTAQPLHSLPSQSTAPVQLPQAMISEASPPGPPQAPPGPPPSFPPQHYPDNRPIGTQETWPYTGYQERVSPELTIRLQDPETEVSSSASPPVTICRPIKSKKAKTKIPEEVKTAAEEWTSHSAPDGRPYYYHAKDKKSVWVKPAPLKLYEELKARIAREEKEEEKIRNSKIVEVIDLENDASEDSQEPTEVQPIQQNGIENLDSQQNDRIDLITLSLIAEKERERLEKETEEMEKEKERIEKEKERIEKERLEQERIERELKQKAELEKQEREKLVLEQEKRDLELKEQQEKRKREERERKEKKKEDIKDVKDWNTPMVDMPVIGTPWLVVWTRSGGVFFFNSAASNAVWVRPAELVGRRDVDRLIAHPPPKVVRARRRHEQAIAARDGGELKRAADSDSDSIDEELSKIVKVVEAKKRRAVTDENAKDIYADIPLEERVQVFRQMLVEKQVSALTSWERELHKIVLDKRYLLLTNEHKKQVYEKYVKERADEEKREKMQQKKVAFTQLMEEARLQPQCTYQEFSRSHGRDARFTDVEKQRARETYFAEHLADLRRRECRRDKAKQDFISMLKEKNVDRHTRWSEVKKRLEPDPRYRNVESALKEDYFKEYCKIMKEEKRKDKDRDRSNTVKKDRDKDKRLKKANEEESVTKERTVSESSEEPRRPVRRALSVQQVQDLKRALRDLLRETRSITHRSYAAVKSNPDALRTMHELLMHDYRYQALNDLPVQRQQTIMTYLEELQKIGPPNLST